MEQLDRIEAMLLNQRRALYALGAFLLENGAADRQTSQWKELELAIRPLAPWADALSKGGKA